ncbi:YdeI/OmpD-associated family protein [Spirilliplanes yamanashiensis]|uniref:DUF1905 domain-containing protein n=1 Tax=Spirilliplanes yamanashiensis TaxID=42233 RepID=A0A8J3Y3D5_9ACTN|nr:YdeI/OmpD-associated family protein [Spirilliplanes yamanashiensis]MDP9814087.1 hypothetical protein [Spirilliplanes yamanashiensis]GIJ00933.1 hypothetical protein Sya03_02850 [Spirilliplanes yamanashiensis]
MQFRAVLEATGGTTTGFRVPPAVVEALGHGRKPPVTVTVGGHTYRNTVAVYDGEFWLGVSAANRAAAGLAAGDEVDVTLELDTAERVVEVPPDLAAALADHPDAKAAFERLSYSRQRAHAESVTGAKTDATRQRRVEKVLAALLGG